MTISRALRRPASLRAAAVAAALAFGATAAMAAEIPPPGFKGKDVTYDILRGSSLRSGDRLLDRIVTTLWGGGQVVGTGDCGDGACPVVYQGQNLWARRTRLRMTVAAAPGTPAGGPTAACTTNGTTVSRRLDRGATGEDVKRLQEALNCNGAKLTADGNFGRGTAAAVEAFQKSKGTSADGVAGRGTLAALGFKVGY